MSFNDLKQRIQSNDSAPQGFEGLKNRLSSADDPVTLERRRQLQREAEVAQFESHRANSLGAIAGGTIKGIASVPLNAAKSAYGVYQATPGKISQDIQTGAQEYQQGQPLSLAKAGFRVAADTANAIFAPLSAAVGSVLEAAGGQKLTDKAGQKIADKSGITDWPAFQKFAMEHPNAGEDFGRLLTLAMAGGEAGKIEPGTALERTHAQVAELAKKVARQTVRPVPEPVGFNRLQVEAQTGQVKVPATPMERLSQYSQKQGYEPYTPTSELPTIQMGPQAKGLPEIQMNDTPSSPFLPPGAKYVSEPTPIERASGLPVEKPVPFGAAPVEGDKVSGMAKSFEAKAIEKNLVSKFNELATYDSKTVEDQARRVALIVDDGPVRMSRILKGEETLPQGVSGQMFLNGAEEYAMAKNDAGLMRDLASSPLTSETSVHAQEMRFAAERSGEASPLQAMKEIEKIRASKVKDPQGAKRVEMNDIKKEISKVSKKQSWAEFVNSIEC